jgi:hypothetical protein
MGEERGEREKGKRKRERKKKREKKERLKISNRANIELLNLALESEIGRLPLWLGIQVRRFGNECDDQSARDSASDDHYSCEELSEKTSINLICSSKELPWLHWRRLRLGRWCGGGSVVVFRDSSWYWLARYFTW